VPSGVNVYSSSPPTGFEGHVGFERAAHVDRRAGPPIAFTGRHEQVRAGVIAPRVPVADEQLVEAARRVLVCGRRVQARARALEVRAVGEHVHGECQASATRGELEAADIEWIVGDLHGLAAAIGSRQTCVEPVREERK
jgi:hypothetical protein